MLSQIAIAGVVIARVRKSPSRFAGPAARGLRSPPRIRETAFGTIDSAKNFDKLGREGVEMDTSAHFRAKQETEPTPLAPSRAPFLIDTRK
jgi:hypothetical protein